MFINSFFLPKEDVVKKYYNQVAVVNNIDKLFDRIIKARSRVKMLDCLTELNLIYQLSLIYNKKQISYEEEIVINGKKYYPDICIKLNDRNLYIQVKRMEKSYDYEERKENNYFVNVYDENQLRQALTKATNKAFAKENDILLVAQEISNNADIGKETISNALFGDEQLVLQDKLKYIQRTNNGLFNCILENRLYGYILLNREKPELLSEYKFDFFPNHVFPDSIETVNSLLPIDNIYTYRMMP